MLASKTGLDRFEATQFLDEGQINAESVKVSRKEKEVSCLLMTAISHKPATESRILLRIHLFSDQTRK